MGNMSRAETTLYELSQVGDSPAWDAALEHYRQTAVNYALEQFEAELSGIVDQLDVQSGDLRVFLIWLWRELDKARQ